MNEIDLRFAKILRFGGTRTHVGIDIFNLFNSDAILTYNQTLLATGAWLDAAVGPDATLREGERADRFLVGWSGADECVAPAASSEGSAPKGPALSVWPTDHRPPRTTNH